MRHLLAAARLASEELPLKDAERRQLERDGDTLEELASQLRARLRAGEISEDLVEFCAYLGDEPAQAALQGALPAGRFVPWDRWAQALPFEFWLAVLAYRYDQKLESGELHERSRQRLEANRAWLRQRIGPPPSPEPDPLLALWRWKQEGGSSPGRGSWLSVENHPIGWDFNPRLLAQDGVLILLGRPLHSAGKGQHLGTRAEVAFLKSRLDAETVTKLGLQAAAEAGYEPACLVAECASLSLPEWLAALRRRSGSWRHQETYRAPFLRACYCFLAEAGGQLRVRAGEGLEPAARYLSRALAREAWLHGEPDGRALLKDRRVQLLRAIEQSDEPAGSEWRRLAGELLEATRAINNRDTLQLERGALALRDLLEAERGAAAERLARDLEIRLNLRFAGS